MSASKENRAIAQTIFEAFGGAPKISKYWDQNNKSSIDILACHDRPYEKFTSYSTLGLSDHSLGSVVNKIPLRVEFVGAFPTEFVDYPNILATCAFNIINSKFKCKPGTIFKDVVKMYLPNIEMKHILFVPPFLWEDRLKTLDFTPLKIVAWLLTVPISDNELNYVDENGSEALETFFEKNKIDVFDVNRHSAL